VIDHPSNRCDGGHIPVEGRPEICSDYMARKARDAEAAEALARKHETSPVGLPPTMTRDEAKADAEQALRTTPETVTERLYADEEGVVTVERLDPLVHHPAHYRGHPKEIECIDIIEDCPRPNLANCIKYIWRVSWGSKGNDLQDLQKAHWYLSREIQRRGGQLP
jgi:hypothetical protein